MAIPTAMMMMMMTMTMMMMMMINHECINWGIPFFQSHVFWLDSQATPSREAQLRLSFGARWEANVAGIRPGVNILFWYQKMTETFDSCYSNSLDSRISYTDILSNCFKLKYVVIWSLNCCCCWTTLDPCNHWTAFVTASVHVELQSSKYLLHPRMIKWFLSIFPPLLVSNTCHFPTYLQPRGGAPQLCFFGLCSENYPIICLPGSIPVYF